MNKMNPIQGLGMVSSVQVAEYLGIDKKELQKIRTKHKRELDKLGVCTMSGVEVSKRCEAFRRIDANTFEVMLTNGEMLRIPAGPLTYYTNVGVARVQKEVRNLQKESQVCVDRQEKPCERQLEPRPASRLEVKRVPFMGTELLAAQDCDGQIWVGVSNICLCMGMNQGQKDNQVERVQTDRVLKMGTRLFPGVDFGQNSPVIALKLDFLPLWLAKMTITDSAAKKNPALSETLLTYQLRAKDVLAEAFIPAARVNDTERKLPRDFAECLRMLADEVEEVERLNAKIEQDRPMVDFAVGVSESDKAITVGDFSKLMYDVTKMGRNKTFRWMRDQEILQKNNIPYQQYIEAGYFELAEVLRNGVPYTVPMITGKGQLYLHKRLNAHFGPQDAMLTQ